MINETKEFQTTKLQTTQKPEPTTECGLLQDLDQVCQPLDNVDKNQPKKSISTTK